MKESLFKGKKVLVTGHTGFKGSWLALWLRSCGAEIVGLSLAPEFRPNHWDCLSLQIQEFEIDIRNTAKIEEVVTAINPDFVFHLAAQAFVRRSYRDPVANWETNVLGTINLLNACRKPSNLAGICVVTTDKCYQNMEWNWGYRETDPLGGHDPYSASKAAVELAVASYRSSFFKGTNPVLIATARAGNVIGGGDWSEDRLVPDIFRAIDSNKTLLVRSPNATRPWQHVLEALSGYILLGERLLQGDSLCARAWNFGPTRESNRTVIDLFKEMSSYWPQLKWEIDPAEKVHEAGLLNLDSTDAREILAWQPMLSFKETLRYTSEWYASWYESDIVLSEQQLKIYQQNLAKEI